MGLHSLPRAAGAGLDQALRHPRVFLWHPSPPTGAESQRLQLLPPAPSRFLGDGEGLGGCSSLVGFMCSPGFGSGEQSGQRQAKGDVGKGAYREEEEDDVNSLFLREAAFRCKVLCHEGRWCCHGSRACQGWHSLLPRC